MHQYEAFDLFIQSELKLPELLVSKKNSAPADVRISIGKVSPEGIQNPRKTTAFFQAKEDAFWFHIEGVARYLVVSGQEITIEPCPSIDEDSIRVCLLGSCFGALLMQRGFMLIHGNAIQVGQSAITFAGHSGAGKSTMTAIFKKRGYKILADDVCAINARGKVMPGYPQIKLWADMAEHLDIKTSGLRKIRPHIDKFALPTHNQFCSNKLPLRQIFILSSHKKNTSEINPIYGNEKLKCLKEHSYRPQYIDGLGLSKNHALQCIRLAKQLSLKSLTRPESHEGIDQMIDVIEKDLKAGALPKVFSSIDKAI